MRGTLTENGTTVDATPELIGAAVSGGGHFWLDLDLRSDEEALDKAADFVARLPPAAGAGPPGPSELTSLLADTFHFHPVAVQAAERFGQRPRIDEFDGYAHIVTYGIASDGRSLAEIHCFVTDTCIISIHQGNCPALAAVRQRIGTHHSSEVAAPQVAVFYLIMDTLIDSFFPVLSDIDDAIDDLESAILEAPTEEQLGTLFDMKRQIIDIRKVIAPQRDMIASLNAGMVELPGMTDSGAVYFRSLYDHLIRIGDMVDAYRDLLTGAMDTHLSMVSNRLNVVMKQLTIIATIFLPLSFITGFFGQNFGWLITHVYPGAFNFWVYGVGSMVLATALLVYLFKRRGWLGSGPAA